MSSKVLFSHSNRTKSSKCSKLRKKIDICLMFYFCSINHKAFIIPKQTHICQYNNFNQKLETCSPITSNPIGSLIFVFQVPKKTHLSYSITTELQEERHQTSPNHVLSRAAEEWPLALWVLVFFLGFSRVVWGLVAQNRPN